jgi:hypothetical protein
MQWKEKTTSLRVVRSGLCAATGENIQREEPAVLVGGPVEPWEAVAWLVTVAEVTVHGQPGAKGESVAVWAAGTPAQVKGVSRDAPGGEWWYLIESAAGEGWVRLEGLKPR